MAELQAVPPAWIRTGGVVALDVGRPVELGVLVEPLHTVINGQDVVGIERGDHVLVLGLGPMGILHAAYAASRGARVVAVDPRSDRAAISRTLLRGVTLDVLDGPSISDSDPFDVVIVAVGQRRPVEEGLALVAPGGRILAFAGLPTDDRMLPLDLNDLHYRQVTLAGSFGGTPQTFRRAAAWLEAHPLDIAALAPDRFPLIAARAAFEAAGAGRRLKTLLIGQRAVDPA
jgi:L-iditol 2-dehydrogenase